MNRTQIIWGFAIYNFTFGWVASAFCPINRGHGFLLLMWGMAIAILFYPASIKKNLLLGDKNIDYARNKRNGWE